MTKQGRWITIFLFYVRRKLMLDGFSSNKIRASNYLDEWVSNMIFVLAKAAAL